MTSLWLWLVGMCLGLALRISPSRAYQIVMEGYTDSNCQLPTAGDTQRWAQSAVCYNMSSITGDGAGMVTCDSDTATSSWTYTGFNAGMCGNTAGVTSVYGSGGNCVPLSSGAGSIKVNCGDSTYGYLLSASSTSTEVDWDLIGGATNNTCFQGVGGKSPWYYNIICDSNVQSTSWSFSVYTGSCSSTQPNVYVGYGYVPTATQAMDAGLEYVMINCANIVPYIAPNLATTTAAPALSTTAASAPSASTSKVGIIAGAAVGAGAALLLSIIVALCCRRRARRKQAAALNARPPAYADYDHVSRPPQVAATYSASNGADYTSAAEDDKHTHVSMDVIEHSDGKPGLEDQLSFSPKAYDDAPVPAMSEVAIGQPAHNQASPHYEPQDSSAPSWEAVHELRPPPLPPTTLQHQHLEAPVPPSYAEAWNHQRSPQPEPTFHD